MRKPRLLTLPPCLIVTQEVSVKAAISYQTIAEEKTSGEARDGTETTEVLKTTKKVVTAPEEYETALQLAAQLRAEIRRLGRVLHSGVMLVPQARESELDESIQACRALAAEYNKTARWHFVRLSTVKALITSDAEAAARDVAWSIQEALADVRLALEECNVEKIRAAALRLKTLAPVLPDEQAKIVNEAVAQARSTANWVRAEVEKKGTEIETVRQSLDCSAVDAARAAFLEYEIPAEMQPVQAAQNARFAVLEESTACAFETPVSVEQQRYANL